MLTALWCYNKEKSGRKTPSKGDITFTEAADSAIAESQYVAELSTPVVGNEDSVQSPATCSDADAFLNTPGSNTKSGGKTKKACAIWQLGGAIRGNNNTQNSRSAKEIEVWCKYKAHWLIDCMQISQ